VHLDVDEAAGEGRSGAADFDARAAKGGEEAAVGGLCWQPDRERFQLLVEGRGGVVVGAGDAPAVEVDGRERLEGIVELGARKGEGDGRVAGDRPSVLEEADTVLVEGDMGYGESCREVQRGCVSGLMREGGTLLFVRGRSSGRNGEQQGNKRNAHEVFLCEILRQQLDG
jgi:hypothetical protein